MDKSSATAIRRFCSQAAATLNAVLAMTEQCAPDVSIRASCRALVPHSVYATLLSVLETGAGCQGEGCAHFEDLRTIIDQIYDKRRIGVCFDTCHVVDAGRSCRILPLVCIIDRSHIAGYPLASADDYRKTFDEFERVVGMRWLRAFHVNDSKCTRTKCATRYRRHRALR